MGVTKDKAKHATPNPNHRNPNTVRTTPRKALGSGPVAKGMAYGRCIDRNPDRGRYT